MFNSNSSRHHAGLEMLFKHKRVAQLSDLREALGVRSRTTVFSALKSAGYFSSYSHAGRYYTLAHIPRFDAHGLWSHGLVRFAKHGTLRDTVIAFVQQAQEGYTHQQLQMLLSVRLHDTLRSLIDAELLDRERVGRVYLYVSADPKRATEQVAARQELRASLAC